MEEYYFYIGIGVLIIIVWYIGTVNRFRQISVKTNESDSDIEVALEKRSDALSSIYETVKGYAKHEMDTLTSVAKIRKGMSMSEMSEANAQMTAAYREINVLAENYPDLKASQNFLQLQDAISDCEEHIQASRRIYNSNITIYNQMIVTFPKSLIAKQKGFKEKEFFKMDESKRDFKIKF